MPIESRIPIEEINVKDLQIEQPEKQDRLEFDPKKDLDKEDWDKMKESLERCKNDAQVLDYLRAAAGMAVLFPDRRNEL